MKYDFDSVIDRKHSNSLKWNVSENELPMWVADMDFKTAPEIEEAISKRMENGIASIVPAKPVIACIVFDKNRTN